MKTKLLLLAMAVFSLASCQKEIIDNSSEQGKNNDEYYIEIQGMDGTKSTPSTVSLNLANLSYASSKTVTAQLKKKSGTSWTNITSGVTYSWSANSTDSQKFSGSGTVNASCTVGAKATGSGTITVSANYGGSVVATQDVPVTVSDDRALSWSNATTPITSGEVYSAVLNSNFSCTATVSSNNTSFLVGTTSSNLSNSTSATFDSNKTKTIYYKYTGSNETTVKIEAVSEDCTTEINFNIILISEQNVRDFWEEQIHNYFEHEYDEIMFTAPISTFPWSDWELRYVFIDWDNEFGTSIWSEYYDDATPLKSQNANSLIRTYMSSAQK